MSQQWPADEDETTIYDSTTTALGDPFEPAITEESARAAFDPSRDISTDSLKVAPRGTKAKQYERKLNKIFARLTRATMSNQKTIPDSATIIKYGPDVAEKAGDLAATDQGKWLATVLDYLDGNVTSNPSLELFAVAVPMALQLFRNHEPIEVKAKGKGLKIPFTKRVIPLHFRFEMPTIWRNFTQAPEIVTQEVFTHPAITAEMERQGLRIATNGKRN